LKTEKKTGTKEWAERNSNIQTGCPYDCRYCYAKEMAIRFKRATPESWRTPDLRGAQVMAKRKVPGVTMFPTAHDITLANARICQAQLDLILQSGDNVLVVTKGDLLAIMETLIPLRCAWPDLRRRLEVRVTLGSANDGTLRLWEPGAPPMAVRLASLRWAKEQGFRTSLSLEPMLDAYPGAVLAAVAPHLTGECWIGIGRDLVRRVGINCPGNTPIMRCAVSLQRHWTPERLRGLYENLKENLWIRWKDSIREAIGLNNDTNGGAS
jgi:hypothetical protein